MKRLPHLFPLLALLLALPIEAQSALDRPKELAPVSQSTAYGNIDRFARLFHSTLVQGCLDVAGKVAPPGAKESCTCFASLFVKRYSPRELIDIVRLGASSPQSARLITLMMAPERKACSSALP